MTDLQHVQMKRHFKNYVAALKTGGQKFLGLSGYVGTNPFITGNRELEQVKLVGLYQSQTTGEAPDAASSFRATSARRQTKRKARNPFAIAKSA